MPDLRPQVLVFFISLLFVGIAFWTGGDLLTRQLLRLSYRTLDKLQINTIPQVLLTMDFTVIDMEIDPEEKFTQVEIKTANSLLKRLELEIPNSQFSQVAIAQELGLSSQIEKLKPNQQVSVKIPLDLIAIKAIVNKRQTTSSIEIITANSYLKTLEFILPENEIKIVESMTAKLLNLSPENVRKLISYQLIN